MQITRTMDLGFDKEQVVAFSFPAPEKLDVNISWPGFKSRLLSHTGISSVTHSFTTPLQPGTLETELSKDDGSVEKEFVMMQIEPDYFATYGINLLAGRYFSMDLTTDYSRFDRDNPDSVQGSVMLSEQAARELGWTPAEAIGQLVRRGFGGGGWLAVVGVVEDTVPSVKTGSSANFYIVPDAFNYGFARGVVSVKIAGANVEDTLKHIDAVWSEFVPGESINRYFLDSEVRALYQQEQMHMRMFTYSALLAVLVACFGLYGLAAFNAERRAKEIGVRKVMGGSVWSIVLLLTNDFSKLVLLSNLIAWPVAYFAMNRWLENFAYRIDLTPLIFIGSGLIALCIAWVTVGGTAAKAASAKPVLALRYE
jgi:putative ABC transport system permease protein